MPRGQARAHECQHGLNLRHIGRPTRADRPHWLVRYDDPRELLDLERPADRIQLARDDPLDLARIALGKRLAYAHDRHETTPQDKRGFARNVFIGLPEQGATFGMPYDDIAATTISEHPGTDLPGKCTVGMPADVLGPKRHCAILQLAPCLIEIRIRHAHDDTHGR